MLRLYIFAPGGNRVGTYSIFNLQSYSIFNLQLFNPIQSSIFNSSILLKERLLLQLIPNIRLKLWRADDRNFVGEAHDETSDAFEVQCRPVKDVGSGFGGFIFFKVRHGEREFFTHQHVGAEAELKGNPYFASAAHAEHVGAGTLVEFFIFVGFVEHDYIANPFQFKVLALFVLGVKCLDRLKPFTEPEWLDQPVRYFLAVG